MSKIDDAFELISGMTLLEARDLVSKIEEEFGVTAAAPVAVVAAGTGDGSGAAEEKTEFTVTLKDFGENKINVITPNTETFFTWEDRFNNRTEAFAFSDRNGGGVSCMTCAISLRRSRSSNAGRKASNS